MLVIIHGWSDKASSFRKLTKQVVEKGLAKDGVAQIHLGDYISLDDRVTFDDLATALHRAWRREPSPDQKVNSQPSLSPLPISPRSVDVIVHSTGALVLREWMTRHFTASTNPVRRLLMLGAANFGSPLAHVGRTVAGRVAKGWKGKGFLETGAKLLHGLEIASPFTFNLAEKDCFSSDAWYGPGRILCTSLVGNYGYTGIAALGNKTGSDGTVRVSTANLNCAALEMDFSSNPLDPQPLRYRNPSGRTAFAVMDTQNHSSIAFKERPRHAELLLEKISGALTVTDDGFQAWCDELEKHSAAVMSYRNEDLAENYHHGYQNTVFRVEDQYGTPVTDYVIEFFANDDEGERDANATRIIQQKVIENVHTYKGDASYRSFLMNCNLLMRTLETQSDCLSISITANPDIKVHDVGYSSYGPTDIGVLQLDRRGIRKMFKENRTLLVTLKLCRQQRSRLFKLHPY